MQNQPRTDLRLQSFPAFLKLTCKSWVLLTGAIYAGGFLNAAHAVEDAKSAQAVREEQQHKIALSLKRITDEEWNQIAGDKAQEKFPVEKGATLWGISKSLFGDAKYWPKIWALNDGKILNPHVIRPGQQVVFQSGSSTQLPAVSVTEAGAPPSLEASTGSQPPSSSPAEPKPEGQTPPASAAAQTVTSLSPLDRSQEWMTLPSQDWEQIQTEVVTAENLILDKAPTQASGPSRYRTWPERGFRLEGIPRTDKAAGIGTIVGSRHDGLMLGKGDMVYIEADTELTEGEVYGITSEDPALIKSRKSDRSGWLHRNLGEVRILAVKAVIYIGQILESAGAIQRNDILIPLPSKVVPKTPIPAPSAIEATLLLNKETSIYATSQYKQVIIDRGSDDGVQPGMVFRSYQYWDPGTGERFTDSDFIIDADILVVHTTEEFSTGIVLSSLSPVLEGSTLVLLTDISDVLSKNGYRLRTAEEQKRDQELNELDQLPPQNKIEEDERRELEQLEQWKKNPDGTEPLIENPEQINQLPEQPASDDLDQLDDPTPGTGGASQAPTPAEGEVLPPPPTEGEGEVQSQPPAEESTPSDDQELDAPPPEEAPPAEEDSTAKEEAPSDAPPADSPPPEAPPEE